MQKKKAPLIFINVRWTSRRTKRKKWEQWGSERCISAVAKVLLTKDKPRSGLAIHRCHNTKWRGFQSAHVQISQHCWLCWKTVLCRWEFTLSNSVSVLLACAVVTMEINRSNQCIPLSLAFLFVIKKKRHILPCSEHKIRCISLSGTFSMAFRDIAQKIEKTQSAHKEDYF